MQENEEELNVSKIEMSKEEAEKMFNAYQEAIENRKHTEKYLEQLKDAYGFLKEGNAIIDIYTVFQETGTNEKGLPKLAISRADKPMVYITSQKNFGYKEKQGFGSALKGDIILPNSVFPNMLKFKSDQCFKTKVPIVPAPFLPKEPLSKYYILWEVGSWEEEITPPRRDPFLLKRISKNLFAVIAAWDLTELEASLIRGK